MTFAQRLKQARKAKGWTMAELGRRAGLKGRQNINGFECGENEPRRDTIEKLATALEVRAGWLAFGEE